MPEEQNSQPDTPAETIYSTETTETPPANNSAAPAADPPQQQTQEAAQPAAPAPLTAEALTLPEGFELDEKAATSFLDIMNNAELSPIDRANALINLQADLGRAASEAGSKAWEEQQEAWQQEVADDQEIGGQNLEKTISNIGGLLDRFGNDEVRKAFDQTGAGNNPHVVRFLNAVATVLGEGKPAPGNLPANGAPKTAAEVLYPNMAQG